MIDREHFDRLRGEYDVIPLFRTLSADTITPVAAFAAVAGSDDEAFLLESVERGESLGRYSFIGVRPRRRLQIRRGDTGVPALLRAELTPLRVCAEELDGDSGGTAALPPFFGGAVGWFGYGAARWSEKLPDRHGAEGDLDAELLFFDQVIAFDHLRQRLFVVANVFTGDGASSEELIDDAREKLDELCGRLSGARADL
ncbi:MAG: hypothetical protein LC732_08320, partial [Acidobacteria bacterium]|nr:hypothetical protein [Acidobacteriota bacterium]